MKVQQGQVKLDRRTTTRCHRAGVGLELSGTTAACDMFHSSRTQCNWTYSDRLASEDLCKYNWLSVNHCIHFQQTELTASAFTTTSG